VRIGLPFRWTAVAIDVPPRRRVPASHIHAIRRAAG
jgi:hypothetical protein